jgi:hypothetical protein
MNDPPPGAATKVPTTSVAGSGYVTRLNALCAELEPKVLAVYGGGGHPAPYPIRVFEEEQPKLTALFDAIDAQADATSPASPEL